LCVCVTERQALEVKERLGARFADIGLLLHPDKTKIVYCKDRKRRREYPVTSFTFCGYEFRPREAFDKTRKEKYTNFLPAPSPEKITEMGRKVGSWNIPRRTNLTLEDIARQANLVLRGWLAYFTVFYPSVVIPLCRRIDRILMHWARKKFKRLKRSNKRARNWLQRVRNTTPKLFAHWALRY
jgi:RNA-directed DNA polymerase